jgi:polysaccharide biosynthesis protein PelG
MAGIGFELRKLLQRENLLSLLRAYAFAGIISSGPWVLSIIGMLIIGILSFAVVTPDLLITQFQVTVTVMIAMSLIITGLIQLAFTRFIADRLFERKAELAVSNYNGVLLTVTAVTGVLGVAVLVLFFPDQTALYKLEAIAGFVIMSNVWIATVFLSGIKQYKMIVVLYLGGYTASVIGALALRPFNVEGLLGGFVAGQVLLFASMHAVILKNFPSPRGMSFEVFDPKKLYPTLMAIGFLYNLGLWIDKFIFWYWPPTSQAIIGPLRASVIYDLPVFMAYLSIIPGMAIFLVRIETDFVEHYDSFYTGVRQGGSLEHIERCRNGMIEAARSGFFEIIKIQSIATLLLFVVGERILSWLQISDLYLPLLYVQTIAAGLQVLFLAILTLYFYLDKRYVILMLCVVLVLTNGLLTAISVRLGPEYYGYGFAISLLIVVVAGFYSLERSFARLEYSTFMLQ